MGKLNVFLEDNVHEDLFKLVPTRKRSQVINTALRKELLHRKRELAATRIKQLRGLSSYAREVPRSEATKLLGPSDKTAQDCPNERRTRCVSPLQVGSGKRRG